VVLVAFLLLFLLTGSVVLPLKAVLLNLLSIGAAFGALVWIFQQGHLSQLLGFTPQSLDPSIPVILFSIVFGMSMDYEVLLVSRIQEEYKRTGDNTRAVADGLERSGRLITGAALIMVAVFMAFGLAEVVLIKAIGIGLAIAVAIDATLVRALAVPALMRLMGDLNWWAPKPLRWLHSRVGMGESGGRIQDRRSIFMTASMNELQNPGLSPVFVSDSVPKERIS
jgi:RND superfamily putative drug exporter